MRFKNIAILSLSLFAISLRVEASFFIAWVIDPSTSNHFVAVAPYDWTCNGISEDGFTGVNDFTGTGNGEGPGYVLSWHMDAGMCGVAYEMNFSRDQNGNEAIQWYMYEDGTSLTSQIGTCYVNTTLGLNCGSFQAETLFFCKEDWIC